MSPERQHPSQSAACFELQRRVDTRVSIDISQSLTEEFPNSPIRTEAYSGDLIAEIQLGDRHVGVYSGEQPNGRPVFVSREDEGDRVNQLLPGKYSQHQGFGLVINEDMSRLVLDNPRHNEVFVTAYVIPGREPFERTY